MTASNKKTRSPSAKRPPATSPEAQENRMISLAVGLAEKQLTEGSASPSVVIHYLKLATVREEREREQLELQNQLLKAKTEQIGSEARSEQLHKEAIEAFRAYSGYEGENIES